MKWSRKGASRHLWHVGHAHISPSDPIVASQVHREGSKPGDGEGSGQAQEETFRQIYILKRKKQQH